jgi:hypothetical protein
VPTGFHDGSPGSEVDIASDVVLRPNGVDVVFLRLRIAGDSPRAAEWRVLVEKLRGHHDL